MIKAAGSGPAWKLNVARPAAGVCVITLSGNWRLQDGLPPAAALERDLASPVDHLKLDGAGIGEWDTGLLTWLSAVIRLCQTRGIELDKSDLPDGVRRLLDLAFAVPGRTSGATPAPSALTRLGMAALDFAAGGREMLRFLGEITLSFGRLLRGRAQYRRQDFLLVMQDVGPQALPIVSLISFLVGLILAYMGAVQLALFGAQIYIADLVGLGMVREIGALMTGIIIAGRTGASFAAQLGTMQVNEEIDAFRTFGISPIDFLVLPRMIALMLMVPLLTLYSGIVGILAGMFVSATVFDIGLFEYYHQTVRALDLRQFAVGVVKGTIYGALVAFSGCLRGMQCGRSAQAVGQVTTSAVVTGILLIVVSASLLTIILQRLGI